MAEMLFREYRSSDIPALTSLWTNIFGDSESLVSAFFRILPETGLKLSPYEALVIKMKHAK